MNSKIVVGLLIVLLITGYFVSFNYFENCEASVLPKFYVDDDYDSSTPGWQVDHFDCITDAINASSAGDRIIVYEGTYNERLTVPWKLDIFGENRDTTIIDGGSTGDVIVINAQHVNISHFTIKNSGSSSNNSVILVNASYTILTDNKIISGENGVTLNYSHYNIIYDNVINSNDGDGIYLNHSNNNSITYNIITSNGNNGVFLYNSSYNSIENNSGIKSNTLNGVFFNETCNYNTIRNNNISSNTQNGVFLNDHCENNTLYGNSIYGNGDSGIRMENSSYNTLRNNDVNYNSNYGVMVVGSTNTLQGNNIKYNTGHGVFLFADDFNTVYNNVIKGNNKDGVHLSNSTNDTIYTNEIASNSQYGVYLDYFTLNNLVYNNYFHDNTNNSMDKSLDRNKWNVTKTSGTNKVGGSYLCGNYWDDFDENSEGAYDTDGDGIADNNYTIYGSNQDKGPLLDVTPPSIGTPTVSPSTQTIGGYTYISATVTDNLMVQHVYLHIVKPDNSTTNFSITQNQTGNTYYCNKKYTLAGTYTYHIAARDSRNWVTSSSKTFVIDQGTPPTITDNTGSTGSPGAVFTFNVTVTDDADAASQLTVKVAWTHGSKSGNYTMVHMQGNYFERSITLDNSTSVLTYSIYASDQWGNSRTTSQKTVNIVDTIPPEITIKKHEYSSDGVINTYIVGATITDNHEVSQAQIEYWYNNDEDHKTATMEKKNGDYYEKTIQLESSTDKVYCIISASDPTGNENTSKKPYANASGPYTGVTTTAVTFNGSNSFDLDGTISEYSWDFGDGTTTAGVTVNHTYLAAGNYTVVLTVTDNDGNTNSDTTYAVVTQPTPIKTSSSMLNKINTEYGTSLTELFYCYDTDGDDKPDVFVDPNNVLKTVHTGSINISGDTVFLISTNDTEIPEFMWNATTDEITQVNHTIGVTGEPCYSGNNIVVVNVTINKTIGWLFIEVLDPDLGDHGTISNIVNVTRNNTQMDSDKIFKKNSKSYILDDPTVIYTFTYSYQPPTLTLIGLTPETGGVINKDNPTVTISYNLPVEIIDATFYMIDPTTTLPVEDGTYLEIIDELTTQDNKKFTYTPPGNLPAGDYELYIMVKEKNSVNKLTNSVIYEYHPYVKHNAGLPFTSILTTLGGLIIVALAIVVFMKHKGIAFESFIYIKNKKILPFFKPLIFGPLRIDVNDEKVSKAEIYVNGKLKDTITKPPFIWEWDEPVFMKQKIETRVYDQNGNESSTGEMTFYIFNPPRFFK
ncbi:MAG: hypothetical protein DRN24_03250 [Thermoplasmata archaeon]|mgnify:CR=1 FL=1|nr:MAG: hypothetical protein DRN24_03250 [Thermoplasmata archaeon]